MGVCPDGTGPSDCAFAYIQLNDAHTPSTHDTLQDPADPP